jgi:hypothetical protein
MAVEDDSVVFVHESVPCETISIAKIYESTTAFFFQNETSCGNDFRPDTLSTHPRAPNRASVLRKGYVHSVTTSID